MDTVKGHGLQSVLGREPPPSCFSVKRAPAAKSSRVCLVALISVLEGIKSPKPILATLLVRQFLEVMRGQE